ncbi:hypothetical protein ASPCADRAFT_131180 [Aspergillus carbonarius ITEM 5010]|uniref:BTB domain-containing protein n=1 Tax=Aspergillus carbonarius (strain ITEM 5010) TaxID=602072 RepID=A0A1R3RJB9_ASPC5|nr:hypothetical protein ASPCADRAFT_131180 [Aspergillus carbonarius ITEM 5010]
MTGSVLPDYSKFLGEIKLDEGDLLSVASSDTGEYSDIHVSYISDSEPLAGADLLKGYGAEYVHEVAKDGDVLFVITTEDPPTRIRVSSEVLKRKSHFYEVLLGPHYREGGILRKSGQLEKTYDDINPAAMLVVMKVVHDLAHEVPDRIELELLKDMAVIVDTCCLLEAVAAFVKKWLENAWLGNNPTPPSQDVVDWVPYVTWVFRRSPEFQHATRSIIMEQSVTVDPKYAYTPATLHNAMCKVRDNLLSKMRQLIRDHLKDLEDTRHDPVPEGRCPCPHSFMRDWKLLLQRARYPHKHKLSPAAVLTLIYEIVGRFDIAVGCGQPVCSVSIHRVLRACQQEMRYCQGIDLDGNPVRGPDPMPDMDFRAINWPYHAWVGEEGSKIGKRDLWEPQRHLLASTAASPGYGRDRTLDLYGRWLDK